MSKVTKEIYSNPCMKSVHSVARFYPKLNDNLIPALCKDKGQPSKDFPVETWGGIEFTEYLLLPKFASFFCFEIGNDIGM